jgi:DNA-binding GntR family transcriptional regulator
LNNSVSVSLTLTLKLHRHLKEPLFVQLCEQMRQRIISGQFGTKLRLLPSRTLATELEISRSTVVTAYEQLVAEGYIEGRRGAGYFVREMTGVDYPPRQTATQLTAPVSSTGNTPKVGHIWTLPNYSQGGTDTLELTPTHITA